MLTLRRLRVLVAYMPADSATIRVIDPNPEWSIADVLLAHIWQAIAHSKKPHPMLEKEMNRERMSAPASPKRLRAVADARQRAAERRRAIEAGEIT